MYLSRPRLFRCATSLVIVIVYIRAVLSFIFFSHKREREREREREKERDRFKSSRPCSDPLRQNTIAQKYRSNSPRSHFFLYCKTIFAQMWNGEKFIEKKDSRLCEVCSAGMENGHLESRIRSRRSVEKHSSVVLYGKSRVYMCDRGNRVK